jgi:WD40 repeat protein
MNTHKNPYIGPRTFQRDEGHLFFGREREARDLIALVASERLVVFYAQSGAGKSSIVNTRLIPNLEGKGYEVLPVGRVSGDTGAGIALDNIYIYNLLRSLDQHGSDPAILGCLSLSEFLAHLNFDDTGFFYDPAPVEALPAGDDSQIARRAVVIDQFEELFSTHPEAWEKREEFFQQLAQAMQDDPQLWVVLVMREDFVAALDPYAHHVSNGLRVRYYMQRLGREAGLKAVKSPVEEIRPYAEGVAEKLIDDLCSIKVQNPDGTLDVQPGQYVEPVQMQVVCYGLWDNLSPEGTQITEKDLQDVGDVNQSLGKYYDKRVGEVAKAQNVRERLIREWFEKKLITAGGIRNMVLQEREAKPGELDDDVIQALQSDLVRGEKRGGATWYELTHDRLVEPILERNKIWFNENLSPLQRQAALWRDQDQNESWLLRDQALVEVEEWAKEHQDELTETEQEFLEACQKMQAQIEERHAAERHRLEMAQKLADEQARAAKRARIFNVVSAILIVIAVILAVFSYNLKLEADSAKRLAEQQAIAADNLRHEAQDQAIKALAGDLISRASDVDDQQPDLAALLNMQAYQLGKDDNVRTQTSLLSTLQEFAGLQGFINQSADQIIFSPDGDTMAALEDGGITLWDIKERKRLNAEPIIPEHFNPVYPIAFNKDGNLLASASQDGTVVIWDALTGDPLTNPLNEHNIWIDGMAFSPTKNILATSADDNNVILWDVSEPEKTHKISVLSGHAAWVANAVFSSDGNTLASTDATGTIILWDIEDPEKSTKLKILPNGTPGIYSLAFGQGDNKKILASAGNDGSIILWDISDPTKPEEITPHIELEDTSLFNPVFSMDGKTLATVASGTDYSIVLWDVEDPASPERIGKPLTEFAGKPLTNLSLLAFSSDGKTLASSSCDLGCKIQLWDTSSLKSPKELGVPLRTHSGIYSIAFSPDGKMLAAGNSDGSVLRWELTNKSVPVSMTPPLKGHTGPAKSVSFSSDGSLLVSTGTYGDPVLIDVRTKELMGAGNILSYTDPENKIFLYHYYDGKTGDEFNQIRETDTGKNIGTPIPGTFLDISPSKNFVACQSIDENGKESINLWSVTEGKPRKTGIEGNFIQFSPDDQFLAVQETEKDETSWIHLINTTTGVIFSPPFEGQFIAFSPDGQTLFHQIDGEEGSVLHAWNIKNQAHILETPGTYTGASQDREFLAYSTQDDTQGNIFIIVDASIAQPIGEPISGTWLSMYHGTGTLVYNYIDTDSKSILGILDMETEGIIYQQEGGIIASSPDNEILAYQAGDSNALGFIDLDQGSVIDTSVTGNFLQFAGGKGDFRPSPVLFGPENRTLVYFSNDNDTIGLLDVTSGKHMGNTPISGTFLGIDPENRTLVYQIPGDNEGQSTISLLNMNSGFTSEKIEGTYQGFTADNKKVISLSDDNSVIRLLDAFTGKPVGSTAIRGNYLGYIPQSDLFASGDDNGMVYVWDMPQPWVLGDRLESQPAAPIQQASLSPDGKALASINGKGLFIQAPGAVDVKPIQFSNRHAGGVSQVEFSPTGSSFFTIGEDGKLILWGRDKDSNPDLIDSMDGTSGAFSFDGQTIIVADTVTNTTRFVTADTDAFELIGSPIPGSALAISVDRKTLAVTDSQKQKTTVWNLATLKQIGVPLDGNGVTFNKTGTFLLVYDPDKSAYALVALTAPEPQGELLLNESDPIFSPNGDILITKSSASDTCKVLTRSLTSQAPKAEPIFDPTSCEWSSAFSPNGKYLTLYYYYGGSLLLDLATNKVLDRDGFWLFSPNEQFLTVGQNDKTSLWELKNLNEDPKELDGTGAQFSPQGRYLITFAGNTLYLWDLHKGLQDLAPFQIELPTSVDIIGFSPNDAYLTVSFSDNNEKKTSLFALTSDSPQNAIQTIPGTVPQFDANSTFLVTSKAVLNLDTKKLEEEDHTDTFYLKDNPDTLAIYSGKGVSIWDLRNLSKPGTPLSGHTASITQLVFTPQQNLLASIASDGIILTEISNPSNEKSFPGTSIDFKPDGTMMAISNAVENQTVLWDISDFSDLKSIRPIENGTVLGAQGRFSPDNKYLITTDNKITSVWNLENMDFESPILDIQGTYPQFSRDGKILAVFNFQIDQKTQETRASSLWNMEKIKEDTSSKIGELTLQSPCDITTNPECMLVAFSPHGQIVAYTDGVNVKLWDIQNKYQIGKIDAPNGVNNLSFIPFDSSTGGSILIVGSNDGTFAIWDVSDAARIQISNPIPGTFVGDISNNTLIYLSNDTHQLVSWEFEPEKWMNQLCAKVDYEFMHSRLDEILGDARGYLSKQETAACPLWQVAPEAAANSTP